MSVHDVKASKNGLQLLDVRGPDEWKHGHIPGARHIFLPKLRERLSELERTQPVLIYCESGYRATLAGSILQQEGFPDVRNRPVSWAAWKAASIPSEH